MRTRPFALPPAAVAVVLLASACLPMGDVLDARSWTVQGEVRSVDARRGRIQVRDSYGGRSETLRYDSRTRVVYRGRQYAASALERGDQVRIRVSADRGGERWADYVEVLRSVREPRVGRTERLDGTVTYVDVRRSYFMIEPARGVSCIVYLPARASRDDLRRFERLRRGERVRVEVRFVDLTRTELVRFR